MEMKMKPTEDDPKVAIKIMERMSKKLQRVQEQLNKLAKDLK